MATTEERMKILKMVEEGKLSAEEGAKLLAALSAGSKSSGPAGATGAEARWFRVRVTDLASGKTTVNISLPVGLLNVGIKMGARFAPGFDSAQMQTLVDAIRSGALGKIIETTDEDERVEIFVE